MNKRVFVLILAVAGIVCTLSAQTKRLSNEEILAGRQSTLLNRLYQFPSWETTDIVRVSIDGRYDSQGKPAKFFNVKTGSYLSELPVAKEDKKGKKASDKTPEVSKPNPMIFPGILKANALDFKDIQNPTPSPDGLFMAFTHGGNLYIADLQAQTIVKLTTDGSNVVYNGYASWVYYEEILGRSSRYKAFWWSPDSKQIAFYHFDDSQVPMFPVYDPSKVKDQILETHYPMAGEKNPEVKVGFVTLSTGNIVWADFDEKADQYFGIPFWNDESTRFIVPWMPRVQQDLYFYAVNPIDGSKSHIYKEHQDTWIDWPEQMEFVENGFYMIRDFTMWEQIYFQSYDGKTLRQITKGNNWGINILKIDNKKGVIYYTSKTEISTRVDVYKVEIKSGKTTRLSSGEYSYDYVTLSEDNKYFSAIVSNAKTPNFQVVIPTDGSGKMTVVASTAKEEFGSYNFGEIKMLYINTPDGYTIPAKIILPVGFDQNKKYPVLVRMYGGPNTPQVADKFNTFLQSYLWWANNDVIQITIDHRASGHAGKAGVNFMYRNFFDIELKDFIEWGKYLQSLPYVNADKIGITGFSYGGSMTTLCVTEGCDYFKYGIAGGGVYDWSFYDSHYTERYMDTPERNPRGYAQTIMAKRIAASGYKGDKTNYLMLTHGCADDNVHIQNTLSLALELQKMGRQFDLMVYPTQYHGYRGAQGEFSNFSDYRFWYRFLLEQDVPEELEKFFSNGQKR